MADELVFTVLGQAATRAQAITLAEAGLREREHLQEWVIAHPEILGPEVLVITSEFDRWESRAGAEKDRLDVLGLSRDGHLVVAELKRDAAPDTVQMQAIKYAAMASRFDVDVLADAYATFVRGSEGRALSNDEAAEALRAHTEFAVSDETLRAPRIVIIAGQFPASVTATVVWLNEMGLDITLTRVQAYRTSAADTVITVSQHFPPPDVEDFLVAPIRSARRPATTAPLPQVAWTPEDLAKLLESVPSPTIRATLDLCSARPGEWVASEEIQARTGREPAKHRGDYGGFGVTLRWRFTRSNAPFEVEWAAGGANQAYYRVDPEVAAHWLSLVTPPEI